MFEQIRGFFGSIEQGQSANSFSDDLKLATAVVLIAASRTDQPTSEAEQSLIASTIESHLGLSRDKVDKLLQEAAGQMAEPIIDKFLNIIREHLNVDQRVQVLSEAWAVIAADQRTSQKEAGFAVHLRQALGLSMEQGLRARKLAEHTEMDGFKETVDSNESVREAVHFGRVKPDDAD